MRNIKDMDKYYRYLDNYSTWDKFSLETEMRRLRKELRTASFDQYTKEDFQLRIEIIRDILSNKKENFMKEKEKTFKCPECGGKVLSKTEYCVSCKKKVKEPKKENFIEDNVIEIQKEVKIGNIILEKGDRIRVLETTYARDAGEKLMITADLSRANVIKFRKDLDHEINKWGFKLYPQSDLSNPRKAVFIIDNSTEAWKTLRSVFIMNDVTDYEQGVY